MPRPSLIPLVLGALVACGNSAPRVLLLQPVDAPPHIRQACSLTEIRCASCHTLDRITTAQHRSEAEWAKQVDKMRLMPASGISVADANVIVSCLVYRDPSSAPATVDAAEPSP